jgi:hypothetical protein
MRTETIVNEAEWYAVCSDGSTEPVSIFYPSREQAQMALENRKSNDPGVYLAKVRWKGTTKTKHR